jgi:hypothetical protein
MIAELLEHLGGEGVEFAVDGNDIIFDAPLHLDREELIAMIAPRKAAIIAYIRSRSGQHNETTTAVVDRSADDFRDDASVAEADDDDDGEDDADPPAFTFDASVLEGLGDWDDESAVLWTPDAKHCPRCRSGAIWTSAADKTRCTNCSPPERSMKLLEMASVIRRRLRIPPRVSSVALLQAMRDRRNWRRPAEPEHTRAIQRSKPR